MGVIAQRHMNTKVMRDCGGIQTGFELNWLGRKCSENAPYKYTAVIEAKGSGSNSIAGQQDRSLSRHVINRKVCQCTYSDR